MEKTINNLAAAFVGESQARNRYTIYAKIAKNEGFEQIAGIFLETADQEREHAKVLMEFIQELKKKENLSNDALKIEAEVPNVMEDTAANLEAAIAGEHYETSSMYPDFAKAAEEEGLSDIAARLRAIAKAEAHHEERYQKLLAQVKAGTVFKKEKEIEWVCRECGYVHVGTEAPKECPSCKHAQAFYQVKCEEY